MISFLPEVIKRNSQGDMLIAMVSEDRLHKILSKMLDESSFHPPPCLPKRITYTSPPCFARL